MLYSPCLYIFKAICLTASLVRHPVNSNQPTANFRLIFISKFIQLQQVPMVPAGSIGEPCSSIFTVLTPNPSTKTQALIRPEHTPNGCNLKELPLWGVYDHLLWVNTSLKFGVNIWFTREVHNIFLNTKVFKWSLIDFQMINLGQGFIFR